MPRRIAALTLLALTVSLLLTLAGPVRAQEPEPTATPTPAYQMVVTLTSGSEFMLSRTMTYGDIAVVVAVIALIVVILTALWVFIPKTRVK